MWWRNKDEAGAHGQSVNVCLGSVTAVGFCEAALSVWALAGRPCKPHTDSQCSGKQTAKGATYLSPCSLPTRGGNFPPCDRCPAGSRRGQRCPPCWRNPRPVRTNPQPASERRGLNRRDLAAQGGGLTISRSGSFSAEDRWGLLLVLSPWFRHDRQKLEPWCSAGLGASLAAVPTCVFKQRDSMYS